MLARDHPYLGGYFKCVVRFHGVVTLRDNNIDLFLHSYLTHAKVAEQVLEEALPEIEDEAPGLDATTTTGAPTLPQT